MKHDIIEVIWVDAEEKGEVGWNDLKELMKHAKKPCPVMHTVGYCVFKDENHISLLSTIGPDECSSLDKIPAAFVKEVVVLKAASQAPRPRSRTTGNNTQNKKKGT